jgi:hypothetical protein
MRRLIPIFAMAFLPLACSTVAPDGCTGSTQESIPGLVRFSSAQEMQQYVRQQRQTYQQWRTWPGLLGGVPLFAGAAPAAAESDQDTYSPTNVQEPGVDEADVIKTDGTNLFVADGGLLRVVRARPPEDLAALAEVAVPGTARAMYLYEGKAVVLSDVQGVPGEDLDFAADLQTAVSVVDVSDPESPDMVRTFVFDGWLNSSRRVDGWLRLILTVSPYLPAGDLRPEPLADWLPKQYVRSPGETPIFEPIGQYGDFYRPITPDGLGVTSIVSVNLHDPSAEPESVSVIGDAEVVYASTEALYLSDNQYGYGQTLRQTTVLHKFDLNGRQVQYVGSGQVTGRVLNQFSLGEYEGYLRVATHNDEANANEVHVLGQGDQALDGVGAITGISPGEQLYAARFVGPSGFLVTFEQIDPLVVLDLSDPRDPRVVGDLEVPGYAEYVHPMGDNYLITVGKDADVDGQMVWFQGVQMCLFDVSDLASPQLLDRVVLGTRGTESEALSDHHAFNYFADLDALAVPICLAEGGQGGPTVGDVVFGGLYVYRVTAVGGFELLGRIPTQNGPPFTCGWSGMPGWPDWGWGTSWTRSVFIGQDAYAITPDGVWAAPLDDVNSVPWSLSFD